MAEFSPVLFYVNLNAKSSAARGLAHVTLALVDGLPLGHAGLAPVGGLIYAGLGL